MSELIQVSTTTARKDEAEQIARALVEERLAACVQVIGPITSIYRWQGCVETSEEWLCLVKTRQDHYPQVEASIRKNHPYEVPEILAVQVVAGSPAYLAWLEGQIGPV